MPGPGGRLVTITRVMLDHVGGGDLGNLHCLLGGGIAGLGTVLLIQLRWGNNYCDREL